MCLYICPGNRVHTCAYAYSAHAAIGSSEAPAPSLHQPLPLPPLPPHLLRRLWCQLEAAHPPPTHIPNPPPPCILTTFSCLSSPPPPPPLSHTVSCALYAPPTRAHACARRGNRWPAHHVTAADCKGRGWVGEKGGGGGEGNIGGGGGGWGFGAFGGRWNVMMICKVQSPRVTPTHF